jgi:putative endonuclease
MYYIYLLRDRNGKLYIGFTNNIKRRLREHLSKRTFTTKKMDNPKLVYYEVYDNEDRAIERERKLK